MTLRGALVEFMPTFLVPLPNVIVFQYNPETITHTWTQPDSGALRPASTQRGNPLAVPGMPGESFSFTLAMDAAGHRSPTAARSRAASPTVSRHLHPARRARDAPVPGHGGERESALLGAGVGAALGGLWRRRPAVKRTVPGVDSSRPCSSSGGRAASCRSASPASRSPRSSTTRSSTRPTPRRWCNLQVLTPDELSLRDSGPLRGVAKVAYTYSQGLRQALAIANLANSAESIIGMLPL